MLCEVIKIKNIFVKTNCVVITKEMSQLTQMVTRTTKAVQHLVVFISKAQKPSYNMEIVENDKML